MSLVADISLVLHTPGGVDHDQKKHGRREYSDTAGIDIEESEGPEEIRAALEHYKAEKLYKDIWQTEGGDYFEWDGGSYVTEFDPNDIWQLDISEELGEHEDNFNKEFWEGPGELYHATTEDHIEGIKENGLESRNETRGMSNRSVGGGVFTSANHEEIGSYGDKLITIDANKMKADGYTPYVMQEPDIAEGEARGSVAYQLNIEDFSPDIESGMSYSTFIFTDDIPAKYLRFE